MSQTLAALVGGMPATGMSLQDILDKAAPGLGFLPAFLRTWFKVDISQAIGLISLMGVTSTGFEFLNRVAVKLYWWITRFCTASVSIAATDRLNREVLNWLGATVLTRQGTRILAARSETIDNDSWGWRQITERDDFRHERRRPVEYLPTFGTTWFVHRMRLFVVRRVPNTRSALPRLLGVGETPDEYSDAPSGNEPLVVMCLGRSVEPIKKFLEDCRDFSDHQREECITIRACKGQYHNWTWDTTILRPIRPIETVHFDERIKAELVRDVTNYLQSETRRFYHQRGVPYRRGYLLHGPPGTGKTSLSLALAGIFRLELYLLHIPSMSNDKELETLFTSLPPRCIVLLEDIDAVGVKRKNIAKDGDGEDDDEDGDGDDDDDDDSAAGLRVNPRTTLSGLLNVLDGVASQEGRIVLMTSNMADKLDPALVRPGRIDRKIFLGNISQESARLMFLRMYRSARPVQSPGREIGDDMKPGGSATTAATATNTTTTNAATTTTNTKLEPSAPEPTPSEPADTSMAEISPEELARLAAEFSRGIPETTLTPAVLQGYLLSHRTDPAAAAREVGAWVAEELAIMEANKALAKRQRERRARKKRAKQLKAIAKLAAEATSSASKGEEEDAEEEGASAAASAKEGGGNAASTAAAAAAPATTGINGEEKVAPAPAGEPKAEEATKANGTKVVVNGSSEEVTITA